MATYRDETEALRARVAELEREVHALRESAAPPPSLAAKWSGTATRLLGAPLTLVEERELDAALDDALLEEILEVLRARFGTVGSVTRTTKKGVVVWQCGPPALQRIVEVTLKPDGARTRLRITERIGALAGGLFGGVVGGVGGGIGLGAGVPLLIEAHRLWLIPFVVPALLLTTWLPVRAAFTAAARRRERDLRETGAEIARVATRAAVPKTRVEDDDAENEEDDGEAQLSKKRAR